MRTFSFINQNDVYIEQEPRQNAFLPLLSGIIKFIANTVNSVKSRIGEVGRMYTSLMRPTVEVYKTVELKHLHNSYKKMDEPRRKIFFLYVKGYSVEEISTISGMQPHNIIILVHNTMKIIHKESSIL